MYTGSIPVLASTFLCLNDLASPGVACDTRWKPAALAKALQNPAPLRKQQEDATHDLFIAIRIVGNIDFSGVNLLYATKAEQIRG
ncbi:hypothetical protein [Aliiroseovarius sp.]|uniref:hypothetical protein n=1 Tax=Aliiroseovarius sp. TaxID=1872442 RepID=UPI003BA8F588